MTSPCKECGKHKEEFPDCFDGCKRIAAFQNSIIMFPEREIVERYDYNECVEAGICLPECIGLSKTKMLY